jgi:hypothetical protein
LKEKFPNDLDLEIHTTNSEAAKGYVFKSSTTVLLDNQMVPLQTALSSPAMEDYLQAQV